jgi:molecular chaperone GrpE
VSKKKNKEFDENPPPGEEKASAEIADETAEAAEPEVQRQEPSLEEVLAASREEAARNWDLYLRARADLENYRKRAQREKEDGIRFANESILREILPVLDNLERAVEHARKGNGNAEGLLQGVEMTLSQFHKALQKFGVTPFSSVGEPFDPSRHEAMGQIESTEHPPNTVAQELQKGCLLNDRLLRPALVMVAKAPAAKEPSASE